jgi:DNA (cytosine-5)-methyltransferase 3A
MIRLLLGGSPCTKWSIAQTNGRETQPNSGIGWELFLNYKIACEKYKPDYFLYENNKSASQAIKGEIARQLGVVEPDLFTPDNGVRMTHINSALVSAQQRERFYVTNYGEIFQPQDRGILLKDVLDGMTDRYKARTVLSSIGRTTTREYFQKSQNTMTFEPVNATADGTKARTLMAGYYKYGTATLLTNEGFKGGTTAVAEAVPDPVGQRLQDKSRTITAGYSTCGQRDLRMDIETDGFMGKQGVIEMCPYFATPTEWDDNGRPIKAKSSADGKIYTVYEVKNGFITIKDKQYPINLPDGFYIIRKLTVGECKRLQTIPDWYEFPVSDTQAYKMIGNGWTIEVIKYLLSHIPNIQNEEIEVLSMYDGMSCGQIALKEMGCNVARYYATEIDKYAIQTTLHNFPNTIQLGDAFQVRENGWCI